jgi:replicative DNA helicase
VAQLPPSILRSGWLSEADGQRVEDARERYSSMSLVIDDRSAPPISQVVAAARSMRARRGLGLVIVDHVQLVGGPTDAERRDLEAADVSRSLKAGTRHRVGGRRDRAAQPSARRPIPQATPALRLA